MRVHGREITRKKKRKKQGQRQRDTERERERETFGRDLERKILKTL